MKGHRKDDVGGTAGTAGKGFTIINKRASKVLDIARFDADTELWESGKLGESAKHAKPVSEKESQALDDALGMQLVSFRLEKSLIEKLMQLAQLEGIIYQPLVRRILTRYVAENEHKLEPPVKQVKKYKKAI